MEPCVKKDDPCPGRSVEKSRCPGCQGDGYRRVLHCWADGGDATCMLENDHDGPHEFTPDSEIVIQLAPSGE